MIGNVFKPELIELIRQRGFTKLRDVLNEFEPVELAEILGDFEPNEQAVFLRLLPKETAADVFEFFDLDTQECLLEALGREQLAELLNEMDPDDRTAILEELPDNVSSRLLDLLNPSERKIADDLLGYPEGSIGRIMIPEYVEIKSSWKVQDVLAHLRHCGDKKESLHQLYVTDPMGKLIGLLRLRNLVIAPLDSNVSELLDSLIISLNATDKQEVAVAIFQKYDRTVLPVVDMNSFLVGVVTVDDIMDVAEEEVTEDFQKMGGMEALEAPYLSLPVFQMIRKRGGWLVILFFGQQLTVFAMEHIKGDLDKMIYLISFLPLIISSGGNTGSQTSTLIIRALATHEVSLEDTWKVLIRELLTSFGLGLILALLSFSLIFVFKSHFETAYFSVALIISFSLLGVVTLGGLIGGIFPFLLSKLNFDPAVCSSPFVTTLIDVSGLLIYFQIARLFMP